MRSQNRFYIGLVVVALIGAAAIAWSMFRSREMATAPLTLPADTANDVRALVDAARGVARGPDNAPAKLLVFSDYMCPACAHFGTVVEPELRRDYIDTGKLQLVYYDFPLTEIHEWAFLAARAGRCAEDQDRFWEYHDRLLVTQRDWAQSRQSPASAFEAMAKELGLDTAEFGTCLKSDAHAQLVTANRELGKRIGVSGTPSLFLNGQALRTEWQDYGALKERVDAVLGQ